LDADIVRKRTCLTKCAEAGTAMIGFIGTTQGVVLPKEGKGLADIPVVGKQGVVVWYKFQSIRLAKESELRLASRHIQEQV